MSHELSEREHALTLPSARDLLDGVLTLSREVHLEMDEPALVERFLRTLATLFPGRAMAVRALDPRTAEGARCYVVGARLRPGVEGERITLKASSVHKTRLKSALRESARIRLRDRWDSPFPGIAHGFAVPLVASGEFYGVLDVGYAMGSDAADSDEPLILPIANHLSVALRNERLHRDAALLRDYLGKLIEHANALILGVDRGWRITVCNQALCRLTGYQREEVIGRDLRDLLLGTEVPGLTRLFRQALAGGAADSLEATLMTPHGRVRTVWSVAAISGRGKIDAVVAVGQDQTRLRELQNQVIQAEKLATLGQLAAGVVHELNNPLTSITVYAEYLCKKLEASAGAGVPLEVERGDVEKLRRIGGSAQRISQLARDLVQYAKPAKDDVELVALDTVVLQSLALCEHLFEQTGVALVTELAEDLPLVSAVPGQLEQVVINLITNAVQAVAGSGTVTLRTYLAAPRRVAVAVLDTGPGVPLVDRERIFEPFVTTKADGQGTGLGLSIVRNIVEQHHGVVQVSEAPGRGAVFTVILPADEG